MYVVHYLLFHVSFITFYSPIITNTTCFLTKSPLFLINNELLNMSVFLYFQSANPLKLLLQSSYNQIIKRKQQVTENRNRYSIIIHMKH